MGRPLVILAALVVGHAASAVGQPAVPPTVLNLDVPIPQCPAEGGFLFQHTTTYFGCGISTADCQGKGWVPNQHPGPISGALIWFCSKP
jgi:hypothetical protein